MNVKDIQSEYVQRKERDYDDSWAATCRRSTDLFLKFIEQEGIDIETHKFDKLDIEDFKGLVENQPNDYAGTTVKNMCMAARDFIGYLNARYGVDANMIQTQNNQDFSIYSADISPDTSTRYEAETGTEIPYITKEEHQELLDTNDNARDDLLLRLLWDTGCRPSEIVNLRIPSDDEDKKIFRDNIMKEGKVQVETAKRDDHKRFVHFGSITKRRFVKWLYKGGREAYSSESKDSEYVFPTRRSKQMQPASVNTQIKRLADRAGIQTVAYKRTTDTFLHGEMKPLEREFVKINAKSYRHAFAVRSCKNGIDLPRLAELMGHSDTDSLKAYTKFLPSDNREAWEEYTRA